MDSWYSSSDKWAEYPNGHREVHKKGREIPGNVKIHSDRSCFSASGGDSSSFTTSLKGAVAAPASGRGWSTNERGVWRLNVSNRLFIKGNRPRYKPYYDDFPLQYLSNGWFDVIRGGFSGDPENEKIYAVQTLTSVVERCIQMTTDPGDLVLDPTCGSGTTAYVAEKWGRRWITCDTSRVAVTLAKQRLMTASYDYFDLKYPQEGLSGGFIYKTVPHITLKSIANNPEIDQIYDLYHPAIVEALGWLNGELQKKSAPSFTVTEGGRKGEGRLYRP